MSLRNKENDIVRMDANQNLTFHWIDSLLAGTDFCIRVSGCHTGGHTLLHNLCGHIDPSVENLETQIQNLKRSHFISRYSIPFNFF